MTSFLDLQVGELDQQRRELYRRYGLEGYALSIQYISQNIYSLIFE